MPSSRRATIVTELAHIVVLARTNNVILNADKSRQLLLARRWVSSSSPIDEVTRLTKDVNTIGGRPQLRL